jgi:hypothetical protein
LGGIVNSAQTVVATASTELSISVPVIYSVVSSGNPVNTGNIEVTVIYNNVMENGLAAVYLKASLETPVSENVYIKSLSF